MRTLRMRTLKMVVLVLLASAYSRASPGTDGAGAAYSGVRDPSGTESIHGGVRVQERETISITIPVGANNKFTPTPQNRGQTTVFHPAGRRMTGRVSGSLSTARTSSGHSRVLIGGTQDSTRLGQLQAPVRAHPHQP